MDGRGAGAQRRGPLTLIDMDHVAESNINRQIHALTSTVGRPRSTPCVIASPRSIRLRGQCIEDLSIRTTGSNCPQAPP
jgi:molybdopterin/thiamine biosynthesis adenylyltransferase